MRRAAVFILLAAVFSMHGIPFLGANDAARTGDTTHAAMASMIDVAPASGVAAVASTNDTGELAPGLPGHQPAPTESHGVDAHLWGACLAIVFAGIALLVAFVLSRRRPWSWPGRTASSSIVSRTRLAVFRPPDLSVLCVLRT